MLGRQSRAATREYAQQDAEADALFAEADRLDDLAGQPGGYRQEITAERAARIRAQLGADLVIGDPGQLAAVPELQDAERDAEIDRLAEIFPEPVPEAQGAMAAPDYYRSAPGSAEHRDAYRQMFAGAARIGFAHPDPDLSYEIDNASELAAERYYEELAARHYRELGGPEADEAAQPGGACMSPGCDCAYGHPDRSAGRQAAAEPGWVDAARWIPGQEQEETEMAAELLSEHAARAEEAWRRERTATAAEHLAQLAHDEQALGGARQDAQMARQARESATRSAYAAGADMQRSALGPELGDGSSRSALPRVLETSPATLAPLAATLPDGTSRADPFLAERGWQAQGGGYVRQPQAQAEAV